MRHVPRIAIGQSQLSRQLVLLLAAACVACGDEDKPANTPQREICDDHLDNDGDGRIDCRDLTCSQSSSCASDGSDAGGRQSDARTPNQARDAEASDVLDAGAQNTEDADAAAAHDGAATVGLDASDARAEDGAFVDAGSDAMPASEADAGAEGGLADASTHRCGDGVVTAPEVCDDGSGNSNAWSGRKHCNATCTALAPYCGDGPKDASESCDDGAQNANSWAGARHCNASCSGSAPWCGDGLTTDVEICDDGASNSDGWLPMAHCNATCSGSGPYCGDGAGDAAHEQCGEPGLRSASQCDSCTIGCAGPSSMTWSGYSGDTQYADAIVDGYYAYTADLRVYDTTTPANNIPLYALPQLGDLGKIVGLSEGRAYMLKGTKLSVVDVRDLAHQVLLGSSSVAAFAYLNSDSIRVDGNRLIGISGGGELQLYDVSEPTMARATGTYMHQRLSGAVGLGTVTLLLPLAVALTNDSLLVLDVRVPSAVAPVGELKLASPHVLKVRGATAFVLGVKQLMTVDFRNPKSPALISVADSSYAIGLSDFVIAGALAFVTGRDPNIISGNGARYWRVEIGLGDQLTGRESRALNGTLVSPMTFSRGFVFAKSYDWGLQAFNICGALY